eukprot:m.17217 g.17217  ORF g.17217 m.17217 type:complete len:416 (+) comp5416_c0_seq2:753-2000(+)
MGGALQLLVFVGCAAFCSVLQLPGTDGTIVTISNTQPKLDTTGGIVNAHDGTYRFFEGYWWYHGAEYGLCREPAKQGCSQTPDHCGFHHNHNVSIWKSRDLSNGSWEFVGQAAECAKLPDCSIMYRPHLVYNPNTKLYVLFYNYVASYGYAGYGVMTASSPAGPFTLINPKLNITRLCPGPVAKAPCGPAQGGAGDFDVFVDVTESGVAEAYLVYSAQFYMSVEKLTPDFAHSTGINASAGGKFGGTVFPDYFVEAPAMFKRGDLYYVLYGHCCCFCYQGSGILVYTAKSPMGPWSPQPGGDLACVPPSHSPATTFTSETSLGGAPTPGQGCLYNHSTDVSTTRAQQNFVIAVPGEDGKVTYVWTGDRWQQAPDQIKGHEGQFWAPLKFDSVGKIQPVKWIDQFDLDVGSNNLLA